MKCNITTLGELSIAGGSYGIAASAVPYSKDLPTYLRITDINNDGTINFTGLKSVSDPKAVHYYLKPNDIVFARTGASTGRSYFYDGRDGDFVYAGFLIKFSINPNKINPKFIKYYCLSKDYKDWVLSYKSGSTRGNINAQTLGNMPVLMLSRPQQDLLVNTLSCLDDKIELNNRISKNLEAQAQAIFKSWFVDFEPWGGKKPEEWEEATLGKFVEIKRGGSPRPIQDYLSDSGLRWLKISDVSSLDSPYITNIKEYIRIDGIRKTIFLNAGALVLSNSATPGIPKILDVASCIHDGWLYFPYSAFPNEYLYLYFKHIQKSLVALGNGSVFTNLKTDILKNFPSIMPDIRSLKIFMELVQPIFNCILNITRESNNLATLRDTLLPKLMSGEIEIPQEV